MGQGDVWQRRPRRYPKMMEWIAKKSEMVQMSGEISQDGAGLV